MDASSLASAALALAVANSQTAALQELLLERERLAMGAEDLRSFFVAARHFTRDLLLQRGSVPPADVPWTWERAHEQRNSDLGYAHALRDVRMGVRECRAAVELRGRRIVGGGGGKHGGVRLIAPAPDPDRSHRSSSEKTRPRVHVFSSYPCLPPASPGVTEGCNNRLQVIAPASPPDA